MRVARLFLVVAMLIAIVAFPPLARDALQALRSPSAYAASGGADPSGRVYLDDNDNGDDDDDDDDDNDGDDDDDDDDDDDGGRRRRRRR